MRAHKRTISASTIDFRPTLTYESTSADLWQQHLPPLPPFFLLFFFTVYFMCMVYDYKRKSTVVSSGVRDVTHLTHICSRSADCLVLWCTIMSSNVMRKNNNSNWDFYLQGQGLHNQNMTVLLYLLLVLNQ